MEGESGYNQSLPFDLVDIVGEEGEAIRSEASEEES